MEQDIKRDRSPKAPKSPLRDAIDRVRDLYQKAGKAAINKGAVANALGYSGISGASLTTIATLRQYGLLDANGESLSVSPLALRLLHPVNPDQELKARRESALLPQVFNQLNTDGFHLASEELLANHLIQSNFSPDSARIVARVFKENIEFAKLSEASNDSSGLEAFDDQIEKVKTSEISQPQARSRGEAPLGAQSGSIQTRDFTVPVPSGTVFIRVPFPLTEADFSTLIGALNIFKSGVVRNAEISTEAADWKETAEALVDQKYSFNVNSFNYTNHNQFLSELAKKSKYSFRFDPVRRIAFLKPEVPEQNLY